MQSESLAQTVVQSRSDGPIGWAEMGLVPDRLIRSAIRRLNRKRLKTIHVADVERSSAELNSFVAAMRNAEIAPVPRLANAQHYEVPAEFFRHALGRHRKYSCCLWNENAANLEEAEAEALRVTCERAGIEDGMEVLDLGCGWGSLSLWIATHYPGCMVTSVSNSASQRAFIMEQAEERGLNNIVVLTRDMNDFKAEGQYDRIVSIEMFEHMRNYARLFRRIDSWLKPKGRFFMHIFCHRSCAYEFVDNGADDWMSRNFFSGGIMPSENLPLRFQRDLKLLRQWRWSGKHYEKTANAWLRNIDDRQSRIMPVLEQTYGVNQAKTWFMRWRMFFMACAELFAHDGGREWYVSHYLFAPSRDASEGVQS